MSWQAANLRTERRSEAADTHKETVEAALNRLSRAYNAAMSCVGAWSRTKDETDALKLGQAARRTFEQALLLDPSNEHATLWRLACQQDLGGAGVPLRSAGHRATVQQLAYLSLVNYADLLLAGCPHKAASETLLDRGLVKQRPQFRERTCWRTETRQEEQPRNLTDPQTEKPLQPGREGCGPVETSNTEQAPAQNQDTEPPEAPETTPMDIDKDGETREKPLENLSHTTNTPKQPNDSSTEQMTLDNKNLDTSQDEAVLSASPAEDSPAAPTRSDTPMELTATNVNPDDTAVTFATTVVDEPEEKTVRLALAAYMDATAVDPSDPILWLKLACAARRLGRLLRPVDHPAALLPYRQLEKGALERAIENRLAKHAWEQFQAEASLEFAYPAALYSIENDKVEILSLPRPSWTTLGRLLLRCTADCIRLQLSPLMALPQHVLGKICQYLEAPDIARFEATCRGLSSLILTARAAFDHQQERCGSVDSLRGRKVSKPTARKDTSVPSKAPAENPSGGDTDEASHRASRASKRLRSQIITSGKRAERQSRRNSTKFCLLATTLGCREDNEEYQNIIAAAIRRANPDLPITRVSTKVTAGTNSSLWTFVQSQGRTDPTKLLLSLMVHISRHVQEVYSGDPGGPTLLTSTLLDCFDLLARRHGLEDGVTSRWWNVSSRPVSRADLFAVDLLRAELSLLRCERDNVIDSKSQWVASMAPCLMSLLEENMSPEWNELKARCHWLTASFYLWRGRQSHNVSESREAETRGLQAIQDTISSLQRQRILTPHLVSPSRKGAHWKELAPLTLQKFRQEIQASSVLLRAQEKFLSVVAGMEGGSALSPDNSDSLVLIGETLLARYEDESSASGYSELVTDFLVEHGEKLYSSSLGGDFEDQDESLGVWFDTVLPTGLLRNEDQLQNIARPCISTILLCCIQAKPKQGGMVLNILIRICGAIADHFDEIRSQLEESLAAELNFSDEGNNSSESSDEEESFSDTGLDSAHAERSTQRMQIRQYSVFLRLLFTKIHRLLVGMGPVTEEQSDKLSILLKRGFSFLSCWFDAVYSRASKECDLVDDLRLFAALQTFSRTLQRMTEEQLILRVHVFGLSDNLHKQRLLLGKLLAAHCDRHGRTIRSRIIKWRADLIASLCCELSLSLSECPLQIFGNRMDRSSVFETEHSPPTTTIAMLCESTLWLWKAVNTTSASVESLDKKSIDRLRVPVASLVVGLCGSATSTAAAFTVGSTDENLGLTDFYDSDTSTINWLADQVDGGSEVDDTERSCLLRVIGQIVHCVHQVFNHIEEKEAVNYDYTPGYYTAFGPSLPLIIVRVLNRLSDRLLVDFAAGASKSLLWGDYPYGTRSTGLMLDSTLFKAYKCLHGFSLVNTGENKETSGSSSLINPDRQRNKPESATAGAWLYRCIMRAYSHGRKSPPKLALDAVLSSLPPSEPTPQSHDIRKYLFSSSGNYSGLEGLCSFVSRGPEWQSSFTDVQTWVEDIHDAANGEPEEEVLIVRRGLSKLISQGAIPQYIETGGEDDRRVASNRAERELSRKFFAILDCLCLGNAGDYEAWYKAAQCLISKADLIADRLGLSRGFSRSLDFCPPDQIDSTKMNTSLSSNQKAFKDTKTVKSGWIQCLGEDLSHYVTYSWSSLKSLRAFSREVGVPYQRPATEPETNMTPFRAWREIEKLRMRSDLSAWQQAWGGLFVSALRKVAFRCVRLSLYILFKRDSKEQDLELLISELTESLGVNLFSELVGSQAYGYPMHPMSLPLKREIAAASLVCFERSVESVSPSGGHDEALRPTWDVKLLIGKCFEKIANSYWQEKLDHSKQRLYEVNMAKALESYNASLCEARKLEKANELVAEKGGGSSHGSCEVLYRLHASRLKCLIRAVGCRQDERAQAELEALRLTECYWYKESDNAGKLSESQIRDRVWNVVVDVVSALVQCRLDFPFFHRSVYRHAQALMWAPILSDPEGCHSEGCFGTVSAVQACKLRGLNSSDAPSSAVVVISNLFDKKRPQLCAVWVTSDSSESTFQTINNSVRKYDSLRGKYISAYIESLRLCKRRDELEVFLKWSYSANRDLPSYFAVSARESKDKLPAHSRDCLLVKPEELSSFHFLPTVKRLANGAFAFVLSAELQKQEGLKEGKSLENLLKHIYACYLRLNCDPDSLLKKSSWCYRSSDVKCIVRGLTTAYQRVTKDQPLSGAIGDWGSDTQSHILLAAALEKFKELFPTLTGSFFTKRSTKGKERSDSQGTKRKDPPSSGKKFEVSIPEGVSAGDTFLTSINHGDKIKKIKLTVPPGAGKTLRFSL